MSRVGLLRSFDFRQLFVADTISQAGTQVTHLALRELPGPAVPVPAVVS